MSSRIQLLFRISRLLETLRIFSYLKLVNALLDVSVHKDWQVIHTPIYAMVRYTALRIVVSADFCRAVTGRNHSLSLGGNTVKIFLVLEIVKTGSEFLESPFLVLQLGTFLLALHNKSRRDMGETHSRIGGIDTLSSRP